MMDNAPEKEIPTASAAPSSQEPTAVISETTVTAAPAAPEGVPPSDAPARARSDARRGGRNRRGKGGQPQGAPAEKTAAAQRPARAIPPALETLAGFYPHLFGAVFRPLKRGIFQDLLAAHPEAFEREALKAALGIHTRSTRYLQSVAAGDKRHDLQGQPVEDMAPEHVHHALLEVYRRRKARATEDLLPKLRSRMVQAFEASGLSRDAYTELVSGRDEEANAILHEAMSEWAERCAKAEALLRAYEASGQSVQAFADMYGMDHRNVLRTLHSARARAEAAAAAAAAPQDEPAAPAQSPAAASAPVDAV